MSQGDLQALLPLLVLAGTVVLALGAIAVRRHHGATLAVTLGGLAATVGTLPVAARHAGRTVTPLLVVDGFGLFYVGLLAAAAFAVALLAHGYLDRHREPPEEFYVLLLLATLGAAVLAEANHFASFFLGLETLSVGLYGLVGYPRREPSIEAGVKYLVLAGASSAFLLFGMALVYAELGSLDFTQLVQRVQFAGHADAWTAVGWALVASGFAFKLALVPFHLWTPDVYQGAPAPATALVATVSKGAMAAILLRFFLPYLDEPSHVVFWIFAGLAVASMIAGNLLALLQKDVKRLLAYSSIAHLGYLLVAFLATQHLALEAVTFYLVAYFLMTLAAFGVVAVLSDGDHEAGPIDDFRGLFWRRPALATVLAVSLFSLAGIPLTAGFIGKYFVLAAGVGPGRWTLVVTLVVTSVVGLFYYVRVIIAMAGIEAAGHSSGTGAGREDQIEAAGASAGRTAGARARDLTGLRAGREDQIEAAGLRAGRESRSDVPTGVPAGRPQVAPPVPLPSALTLGLLLAGIFYLGIYPQPLLHLLHSLAF